ncbi:creatinase-like [Ptychodera flava]|uniref:creatinase-like n=1 Tax=Ptychodera flava TaxID=63121 RepID=UPI003969E891
MLRMAQLRLSIRVLAAPRARYMSPVPSAVARYQHTSPTDLNLRPVDKAMPRLVDLRNGQKVKSTFSKEEMDRRVDGLRKHMEENGLVASLFTSYHNINYFSDFLYCSFGRPYALIVTMDKTVSISANIDGGQPWRRSQGDNVSYTDWHKDNFYFAVGKVLQDYMGKVGIEFDHMPLENFKKFEKALPVRPLVDVGEPTMRMRMIKSPEEIALIKEGARIADLGGQACVDAIVEGVREHEVALAGTQAMVREIADTFPHAELRDTWVWFQSGLNTDGAHNPVTARRILKGDILSLNCFPMIAGYYTALERTMFYDHVPSDRHLELWEINCEVHRKGIELIKPGVRCCDIAAELNEIYKKYDVLQYRTFGYGHSFGTLCHYYGREAGLELREDVETKLEPGMVVSMEPMIMLPEGLPGAGGYREHDILVVTKDGAENITKFPYGPEHLVIKK